MKKKIIIITAIVLAFLLALLIIVMHTNKQRPLSSTQADLPIFFYYNGITYRESGRLDSIVYILPDGYELVGKTIRTSIPFAGNDFEATRDGFIYYNSMQPDVAYFISEADYENTIQRCWITCVKYS